MEFFSEEKYHIECLVMSTTGANIVKAVTSVVTQDIKQLVPYIIIAGRLTTDPVKEIQTVTKSGKPEGKRDSTGLIHCISCKTVHLSLPDFIQHCKSSQHSSQVLYYISGSTISDP